MRRPRGAAGLRIRKFDGANRDRTGDLLLAKRPLARPISALKVADLQGFLVAGLGAKIGADARRLSAIIVVSGTFGDQCLAPPRPNDNGLGLSPLWSSR
jgi:hypothetical protein